MSNEIDSNASAQRRTSKLLAAMGIFVALGIVAYIILTLLVNRSVPANPDTHYTGSNGVSVYYDSSIWKVCRMTEDTKGQNCSGQRQKMCGGGQKILQKMRF